MTREPFSPFDYITSHPQGIPNSAVEPTPEFVREVEWMLSDRDGDARAIARWIVERIDEHGVQSARPVFDMEGNGPHCSYCGAVGPICGHPERSIYVESDQ